MANPAFAALRRAPEFHGKQKLVDFDFAKSEMSRDSLSTEADEAAFGKGFEFNGFSSPPYRASFLSASAAAPAALKRREETQWTTVLIIGCDSFGVHYGSCAAVDPIRIPKELNASGKALQRGSFYRVQFERRAEGGGQTRALAVDGVPVDPEGVRVESEGSGTLKVWCYSRIVSVLSSSFIVHNELIGKATLPFAKADSSVQLGSELATLYCRIKDTKNPWLVTSVRLVKKRMPENCLQSKYEEVAESELEMEKSVPAVRAAAAAATSATIPAAAAAASGQRGAVQPAARKTNGRVIELMGEFMKNSRVYYAIKTHAPQSFQKIQEIIKRSNAPK